MKILFIGNSFTARNDMPGMIAALAESRGERLEHDLVSAGGASLRRHWNKGDALARIRRDQPDCVVLQEQSTLPVKNAGRMHDNIRLFAPPIAESGASTALYVTWARQNAPATQDAITGAYAAIAAEIGAALVPVGPAWQAFTRAHATPNLYDRDLSHPSPAGSYLAACVFYAVLFGRTPVGLPPLAGLNRDAAALMQQSAGDAVPTVRRNGAGTT
jgi:hypothetical protein